MALQTQANTTLHTAQEQVDRADIHQIQVVAEESNFTPE